MRAVEAEQLRARRLVAHVAVRAGVVGGEEDVRRRARTSLLSASSTLCDVALGLASSTATMSVALRQRQRLLDRFGQPRAARFGIVLQAIDDDLDVVLDAAVELQVVGQPHDLAIDAGADEAALEHVREEVLVLALLAADDRGEDQEARALRQGEDAGEDLLARSGR